MRLIWDLLHGSGILNTWNIEQTDPNGKAKKKDKLTKMKIEYI